MCSKCNHGNVRSILVDSRIKPVYFLAAENVMKPESRIQGTHPGTGLTLGGRVLEGGPGQRRILAFFPRASATAWAVNGAHWLGWPWFVLFEVVALITCSC